MTGNCSASQRVLANSLRVVSAKRGNPPLGGEVMVPRDNRTLVFSTELLNYITPFATQGKIRHYDI